MRLVIVSDTHELHEGLRLPSGDVLIHCGDAELGFGPTAGDVERLDRWFARQDFGLILAVGGNHDFALEVCASRSPSPFRSATYLQDSAVDYRGATFYGAPWVPELASWAFYQPPNVLRERWQLIPDATNVLITHTPPFGVLDRNRSGKSCGCPSLRERVRDVRPHVHCFGHIHASAGQTEIDGTNFVNATVVDSSYRLARPPTVLDF